MRVLHVNTARDYRGGERQTLLTVAGLHAAGVDVRLATPPGSELAARMAAQSLPPDRIHAVPMKGEVDLRAIVRLARLCRAHRIDLMHLQTAHAHALGVAAAALARDVATVVSRRVDYPMAGGFFSRLKYRRARHYIAISEAVRRILVLDGVPEARVHLVRSGIVVPAEDEVAAWRARRDALRAARGLPADARIVLNVGALVGHKGQAILPEAARILAPSMMVLVAGEGPERPALEAAIERNGVASRVRLLGHQAELAPLYALADAYVQPSTSEGLGTAMLDAMAFSLPVVATLAGGIPEAVTDGDNGILLGNRNPYLLGEALKKVLSDPALAARLGARGRAIAIEKFSADRMVRETAAVYGMIVSCPANE